MIDVCHCGYKLPRVLVQLETSHEPPADLRLLIACPACNCWYEREMKLRPLEGVPPAGWQATNAPGGSA